MVRLTCRKRRRHAGSPSEAYLALSTADAKFPEVTLSTGETGMQPSGSDLLGEVGGVPGGPVVGLKYSMVAQMRAMPAGDGNATITE